VQTILNYTRPSHADYAPTMAAFCRIKEIADLINQKKREFDNFQELLALKRKIDPPIPVLHCFREKIQICSVVQLMFSNQHLHVVH
jgi:hypothetical protein